ncbi:hypothetical protein J1N35_011687 [Gossypium stocksii]|uniref:Uncharacterized protein n=1 Tax=Gossypium stocksii TaxID=47602 RepID=A0A9D3W2H5_9ROSI|nr:hypothetical protein J1N35_011687 [Gossypium stocksii]
MTLSSWLNNATNLVFLAIPTYLMSTVRFSITVCKEIEKLAKGFIWGSTTLGRRSALINWQDVCLPVDNGGLGIRSLTDQNKIFLLKMGYDILTSTNALWVHMVRNNIMSMGYYPNPLNEIIVRIFGVRFPTSGVR